MSEEKAKKYCAKCGTVMDAEALFCPNCGNRAADLSESQQAAQPQSNQQIQPQSAASPQWQSTAGAQPQSAASPQWQNAAGVQSKGAGGKEKKKGSCLPKVIIAAAVIVVLVIVIAIMGGGDDTESRAEELCEEVQNGYLGNYDTVTVKEVIEYLYAGGAWTYGTSTDGEYYIVDYCNEEYIEIQFTVYDDGSETFEATGFDSFTDDTDTYSKSALAAFLNSVYGSYISSHPECGLTAVPDDEKDDATVLEGHFGPVKSVGESANTVSDDSEENSQDGAGDTAVESGAEGESEADTEAESESESEIDIEAIKEYLIDFNEIRAADAEDFTDEELVVIYNELMDELGQYDIDIDQMKSILCDSEVAIMSAEYADTLYKRDILDLYEELVANDCDEAWIEEMREIFGYYDSSDAESETINIYGSYYYDDGSTAAMTAEIGVETDTGNNYIFIDAYSYQEDYTADFYGELWQVDGNVYCAVSTDSDCYLSVEFSSDGMTVIVDYSDYDEFFIFSAEYEKTADLNLDEVG